MLQATLHNFLKNGRRHGGSQIQESTKESEAGGENQVDRQGLPDRIGFVRSNTIFSLEICFCETSVLGIPLQKPIP